MHDCRQPRRGAADPCSEVAVPRRATCGTMARACPARRRRRAVGGRRSALRPSGTFSTAMFEDRSYKRTFYSAPQSVTSLVAAFLEPTITVLAFCRGQRGVRRADRCARPDAVPAGLRAHLPRPQPLPRQAARTPRVDIVTSWLTPARHPGAVRLRDAQPAATSRATCCWRGRSSRRSLQWLAVWLGQAVAAHALVEPAGTAQPRSSSAPAPLGVKVARALAEQP